MSGAKQVRRQYGLTQQQLADYLGITKGLLAMAELGKRTLPTAALLKLSLMQQKPAGSSTAGTEKKITARLEKQQAAAAKAMEAYARKCATEAALARKKLTLLKKNYDQAVNVLTLVSQLRQGQAGSGPAAKKDVLWQNMVEAVALKRLDVCGEGAQQLLRLKMEAMEKQAAKAKSINYI